MSQTVLIIGGGHNGLVAAFYLARAGLRPIVLERRHEIGGGAITGEISPGFTCPVLAHDVSSIGCDVVRDMALERHGAEFLTPPARLFAPDPGGRSISVFDDTARTRESIRRVSPHDADAYPAFVQSLARASSVLGSLFAEVPPDVDNPSADDLWQLLKAGRRFRALGKRDGFRLLRWAPMPVADLAREWFDSELLGAAISARGISGTRLGPRSAGSSLVLLMSEAHRQRGGPSRVRGGPGALTRAMAVAVIAAGAEIRTGTAVHQITVHGERVTGVTLEGGDVLRGDVVLSAVDPKTTFLKLLDPLHLTPDFVGKIGNYRCAGTVAKLNLALSALPGFVGLNGARPEEAPEEALSGRIHLGPTIDFLERAFDHVKYGEISSEPWLDITIPSIVDPSLAPSGAHVMSVYIHFAPYELRHTSWPAARASLRQAAFSTLKRYAPGIEALVVGEQLLTPADFEQEYGFTGGHIFHGELALDQLFTMRPLLGFANYRTPIEGLYLCGAGTHPGGFMSGASGRLAAQKVLKDFR